MHTVDVVSTMYLQNGLRIGVGEQEESTCHDISVTQNAVNEKTVRLISLVIIHT